MVGGTKSVRLTRAWLYHRPGDVVRVTGVQYDWLMSEGRATAASTLVGSEDSMQKKRRKKKVARKGK